MKKLVFLIVCSVAFTLTSCIKSKEKTCVCVTTYSDPSYNSKTEEVETSQDCDFYNDAYVSGGLSASKTCTEK